MSVKGTITITLSGPSKARDTLLEAFADASIAAREARPDRTGPDEEAKGWVTAEFRQGTDSPSGDFQQECMARATAVAGPLGYEQRGHGVVMAGAAQLMYVIDRRSNQVVMKHFGDMPAEALAILSEELGIPKEFIEITEPPGLWTVPDA